ncbi:MAG: ABC transporter substrate-binding protein [Bacteroidaceae bacterium]|nr:ABC transporter substrate-binding protein [Bacteroidaceae bacterium]
MRKLGYLFVWLLAMGLCGACNRTDKAANDDDSTALRLGVLPTVDCLPFYYADSLGLFDSLGVKVRLVTFDAAMDADTAFVNGDIDGIVTDLVKVCIWRGQGDSAQVVMGGDVRLWLVTAQNARLLKAESIKEKIIGITRHSVLDFFADKILESVKLQSLDLNKPQINNIKLRTLMVDQNQYDGAILPEPFASEAVARGAKRLTGTEDLKVADIMCVVFADSVYKARKEEVGNIRKVYDKAVLALNADSTSNVLDFIPKENGIDLPDTLFNYVPLRVSFMPTDSMMQAVDKWVKGRGLKK